jgi:hypothetical protein
MTKSVMPLLHAAERREDDQRHHQAAGYKDRSILEKTYSFCCLPLRECPVYLDSLSVNS